MPKQPKALSRAHKHTKIENISIFGAFARLAPVTLHFYSDAYLSAAKGLPCGMEFNPVRPYLVCHALELALKAFLSLKGRTLTELARSLNHEITNLLAEAEKERLADFATLTREQRKELEKASIYYSEKVFEYPAIGEAARAYPQMPQIDLLIAAADALVNALREPCLKASA